MGFPFLVCLNSLSLSLCKLISGGILAAAAFYLLALIHFSEFINPYNFQPPIIFSPTKARVMTNLLMLSHLCFKSISGNIDFDLYYTFYKCIFRIYFDFLLAQLIFDHIEKHFDCLRVYNVNVLHTFSC